MKYTELKKIFVEHEKTNPKYHMSGYITFTANSFDPLIADPVRRTYRLSSNNKAFQPVMCGKSIFGYCLDGSDPCVRLDWYIAEEHGPVHGWVVEDCKIDIAVLSRTCDREIAVPRFYLSEQQAIETMLLETIRVGEIFGSMEKGINEETPSDIEAQEITELLTKLDDDPSEMLTEEDDRIGYSLHAAWVSEAVGDSNWDWRVHTFEIQNPSDFCFQMFR